MSPAKRVLLVVLDGPAGAGKSTIARRVADSLGAAILDTGAIYRSLALVARKRGIRWLDESALAALASDFPLEFRPARETGGAQQVVFDGQDITDEIRLPEISDGASKVSSLGAVRASLLGVQRSISATALAAGAGCVAEGRDMGSVVFPEADVKIFLTAELSARARRRHAELRARGADIPLDEVQTEMRARDARDSTRESAPLVQAPGALRIDSSTLDIEGVLKLVMAQIERAQIEGATR